MSAVSYTSEIKLISFDGTGTLFYFDPPINIVLYKILKEDLPHVTEENIFRGFQAANEYITSFSKELEYKGIKGIAGLKDNERQKYWIEFYKTFLEGTGLISNDTDIIEIAKKLHDFFDKFSSFKLYPDVINTLEFLSEKYILILVNNWNVSISLKETCRKLGIIKYFDMILESKVIGADKPYPDMFRIASKYFNVDTRECAHVGDSPSEDLVFAYNVGALPILVDRNNTFQEGFLPFNIKHVVIHSLDELMKLFK